MLGYRLRRRTAALPFCTLTKAAAKAVSGDTVQVIAGAYTGSSASPASGVTFTANQGVTISGGPSGAKGFSISGKSNVVVSGFTITGTPSYGIYVNSSSNITISGNNVSFSGQPVSGQSASGIYLSSLNGGLIKGNVTHDNAAHGILLTGSTTGVTVQGNTSYHNAYQWERNANGIDVTAPGNFIIGNVTYANEDTGINMYTGGDNTLIADNVTYGNGDHGIDDFDVTGGRIIGNTVYGNCTDGINVEGTSANYVIEDNVSANNATGAAIHPTPINYVITKDCKDRRLGTSAFTTRRLPPPPLITTWYGKAVLVLSTPGAELRTVVSNHLLRPPGRRPMDCSWIRSSPTPGPGTSS